MQSYFVNAYRPRILVDQQLLKNLDPAWKSCNIIDIGSGYDPPRTLVPAGVLTDDAPTLAAKPTPAPHSVAESPGPMQTSDKLQSIPLSHIPHPHLRMILQQSLKISQILTGQILLSHLLELQPHLVALLLLL